MTTKKLTDLTELTTTAAGDYTHVVDVSDATDDPAGSSRKVQLANLLPNSGVTAGSYGDGTHVAAITVNAKGQVTSASAVSIPGGGGGISALTGDVTASGTGSVAATVVKINGQTPATVATTGAYGDLSGKPSLAAVATSGAYSDLTGKPTLGTASAQNVAAFLQTANNLSDLVSVTTARTNLGIDKAAALTDAATITWDGTVRFATVTLTGNHTLSLPSPLGVGRYSCLVIQDATGNRTLTLAAGFKTASGVTPTFSTGANAVDLLDIISNGTNAFVAAQYNFQ